ncbi:MAG: chromosome segregation protein SMC [Chlamydiales bacterium]|nr:chromosome segregation protein SMC [Chlamydiales bacterium]
MKLKNVTILGFKSFADKTVLDFGSGIAAIVGPNGCGKSNIVDAFRWVLGEQSAKSIRGDKMYDLIFSGAGKRKALNVAEVTLTFDNEAKVLPIDYSEVSVTRRIYRSGESEYLINRKPVRLRDIESLFWDTGLGKDAYCIFEQGKIDHVIHDGPQERRLIFEEASGILRFKQRKRETLKKLEQVAENLARAEDIHHMVFEQKELLESQAKVARIYKESKTRLEFVEKQILMIKWYSCKREEASYLRESREITDRLQIVKESLASISEKEKSLKSSLKEKESALVDSKDKKNRIKANEELKRSLLGSEKKQREELFEREKRLLEDQLALKKKQESKLVEHLQIKEHFFSREKELEEIACCFKAAETQFITLKTEENPLRMRQKELQQELLKLAQSESKFQRELQEKRLRLETGQERCSYLRYDEERIQTQLKECLNNEKEKRDTFEALSKEIDVRKKDLITCIAEVAASEKRIKELNLQENELQKAHHEFSAKRKALLALKDDFEGISKGSKRLLQESKQKSSSLFGLIRPLYEMIHADSTFEKALGPLLRVYTETLVVESKEHLNRVLHFAKEQGIKEFSIFCLEDIDTRDVKQAHTLLEHITKEPIAKHFFASTQLAEESSLFAREGFELTSKEGYFLDHKKVLFFPVSGEKNTFLREARVKEFEKEIQLLQEKLSSIAVEIREHNTKKEDVIQKKGLFEKELRQLEMKLVEANFGLQRVLSDKERFNRDLQNNIQEKKKLEDSLEEVSRLLLKWIDQEADVKHVFDDKSKQFQALEDALNALQEDLKSKEVDLKSKENLFKKSEEERQNYKRSIDIFSVTQKEHVEQEERLVNDLQAICSRKDAFKETIKGLEEEITLLKVSLVEQEGVFQLLKQELDAQNILCKEVEKELKLFNERQKKEEEQIHQLQLHLVQEQATRTSIEEQMQGMGMELESLDQESILDEKNIQELQKESGSLKEMLAKEKDVNLAAIDEYEKQKEQEQFLNGQLLDLKASKDELMKIIAKLDDESLKLFTNTFNLIRDNFKKNFQLLFEGGDADLRLTNHQDPLESGVDIIAKPPGKEMRSILLLSGGEKCLTALALLFAIFEVKPSAFCLLDEVDAPLDEMNVDRFTRMLRLFSSKTQFIVITHNKRTMSIADLLLGISMEEKGVSKLLSLEFEAAVSSCN